MNVRHLTRHGFYSAKQISGSAKWEHRDVTMRGMRTPLFSCAERDVINFTGFDTILHEMI